MKKEQLDLLTIDQLERLIAGWSKNRFTYKAVGINLLDVTLDSVFFPALSIVFNHGTKSLWLDIRSCNDCGENRLADLGPTEAALKTVIGVRSILEHRGITVVESELQPRPATEAMLRVTLTLACQIYLLFHEIPCPK